jgi:hypothetical protein
VNAAEWLPRLNAVTGLDDAIKTDVTIHSRFLGDPAATQVPNDFSHDARIAVRNEASARGVQRRDKLRRVVPLNLPVERVEVGSLRGEQFVPFAARLAGVEASAGLSSRLGGSWRVCDQEQMGRTLDDKLAQVIRPRPSRHSMASFT